MLIGREETDGALKDSDPMPVLAEQAEDGEDGVSMAMGAYRDKDERYVEECTCKLMQALANTCKHVYRTSFLRAHMRQICLRF